jgi:hypothetical protein
MPTVTYTWSNVTSAFFVNQIFVGDQAAPAIAGLSDGRYFAAWRPFFTDGVQARILNSDGTPAGTEFQVNSTTANDQYDVSVARLARGTVAVTFTDTSADSSGDVRARLFTPNGIPIGDDFVVDPTNAPAFGDLSSSVAALADSGFVVTWTRSTNSGPAVRALVFNSNGSVRSDLIGVDTAAIASSAAGLAGGNFVIAWEEFAGNSVWFRRFDAQGDSLGVPVLIDNFGSVNGDIQTLALRDGGFAVAYLDNGWAISGTEITLQIFNADGSARTDFIRANTVTTGNQTLPTLTLLSNGYIVVGWSDGDDLYYRAFTPQGTAVGPSVLVTSSVIEAEIAGLSGGLLANVRSSTIEDFGGDNSIRSSVQELTRTITSDDSGETLTGDTLRDFIFGNGGDDILNGGRNDDRLDGGSGIDRAVFVGALAMHAINWDGPVITFSSATDGFDTAYRIEDFAFDDGTVTQHDDNRGVDDLFYYSRNLDVWSAQLSAETHYEIIGWIEGRDPNPFFSTNSYLSANGDVRAAHVNPLAHYHANGWREGRDAGAAFDTELYLLRNPDVAAAQIDPLEHFLASGREEGRSAHAAVGRNIIGGFDPEFYLLSNPDVGFAGIDPLLHYNVAGFQEGRNPNAYFDTAGYLAHYADVAAAGANPLEHYHLSGWREGRDPSGAFDTDAYLAAYPDVAAANIDPLEHFLRSGIYEGRSAFGDGVFD